MRNAKSGSKKKFYSEVEYKMKCTQTAGDLKILSFFFKASMADIEEKHGHIAPLMISNEWALQVFVGQVACLKEKSEKFIFNKENLSLLNTPQVIHHILTAAIELGGEDSLFLDPLTNTCSTCKEEGKTCISEELIIKMITKIQNGQRLAAGSHRTTEPEVAVELDLLNGELTELLELMHPESEIPVLAHTEKPGAELSAHA